MRSFVMVFLVLCEDLDLKQLVENRLPFTGNKHETRVNDDCRTDESRIEIGRTPDTGQTARSYQS